MVFWCFSASIFLWLLRHFPFLLFPTSPPGPSFLNLFLSFYLSILHTPVQASPPSLLLPQMEESGSPRVRKLHFPVGLWINSPRKHFAKLGARWPSAASVKSVFWSFSYSLDQWQIRVSKIKKKFKTCAKFLEMYTCWFHLEKHFQQTFQFNDSKSVMWCNHQGEFNTIFSVYFWIHVCKHSPLPLKRF